MPIPQGYELTEEGKKYASYWNNYSPDPNKPGFVVGADGKSIPISQQALVQKVGGESGDLLSRQKTDLEKTLLDQKAKDTQAVDDLAASRGITRGGSVLEGYGSVADKYAKALTSGLLGLEQQNQTYDLAKQDQLLRQKIYDATYGKATNTTRNIVPGTHYASGGFGGVIPAAAYDSTANGDTGDAIYTDNEFGQPRLTKSTDYAAKLRALLKKSGGV